MMAFFWSSWWFSLRERGQSEALVLGSTPLGRRQHAPQHPERTEQKAVAPEKVRLLVVLRCEPEYLECSRRFRM